MVITGGASGIGLGISHAFAAHGAHVVLLSRTEERLAAACKDIEAAGGEASFHACDVRDADRLDAIAKEVGAPDVLINAAAGKDPVKVSQETFDVIAKSLWISKLSEGTFDITFASMGKLWQFDEGASTVVPDPDELEAARKKIDYRKVKLDPDALTVQLTSTDTRINLGGIAKGYAIDKAAAVLRKKGLSSFFAQAGGDLYVEGRKPNGAPWRVGVRDPRGPEDAFFALIGVENHAFSTAGDYERAFVANGKRYHHIIDPRTGYPATASRSVTIWAKDALTADAIDDAVFILGVEKGMALVDKIDDCGAVIVDKDNKVHISPRLRGVIQILREPSDGP